MVKDLKSAIENLYLRLHEPKPVRIEGCPCCTDQKKLCRILAVSRDHLSGQDLYDFMMSAFWTQGDAASYRYFLPRMLELAIMEEDAWGSFELFVVLRKLKMANWNNWPRREQEALDDLLSAKFDDLTLADQPDGGDIDQMICGLALAGEPLAPYFAKLIERPKALRAFFGKNASTLYAKRKLSNDSWRDDREAMMRVMEWLKSPPVQAVVAGL
jgi:hypothetical protein